MKQWFKTHFIPHQANNYQPTVLQKAAMGAMLGLVVLSFMVASMQSLLWTNIDWMVSAVLPAVIVEETNTERSGGSLGRVTRNPLLDQAATLKAEHMAANGYFSHYSPDGISPWYWFNQVGYSFIHAGENLAVHFTDSEDIVDAWMQSPSHRANIMNTQFTEIGIGVARGEFEGSDTIFVVQLFGTPMNTVAQAVPASTPTPTVTVVNEQVEEPVATPVSETQVASADQTVSEEPVTQAVSAAEAATTEPAPEAAPETSQEPISYAVEVRESAAQADAEVPPSDTLNTEEDVVAPAVDTTRATDTITTSTEAVIGSTDDTDTRGGAREARFGFLTSPETVLQMLYIMLALFVALTLALSTFIEVRRQHPVQIAYSAGLAAVMFGLFFLHGYITAGVVIA